MNISREDYLKLIYSANLINNKLTNKDLADQLQISPPSVSEMLTKLISAGKVSKDDKLGYKLEKGGIIEAQNIIRKHRLWEVFLVNYLGYDWQEVHEDAEILEHATSDKLSDRLNNFLQHPKTCPHGSIIFGNSETTPIRIGLDSLTVGESGILKEVYDDTLFINYLNRLNLHINDEIQVLFIEPFDKSMILKTLDNTVSISHEAALKMLVEIK